MYFEIFKNGKLVSRGTQVIGGFEWDNELMYVPSTSITLPIWYKDFIDGHGRIHIHVGCKVFRGIILRYEIDKVNEIIKVDLEHEVHEWTHRQISVNNAVKDKNINVVFKGAETDTVNGVTVSANPFDIYEDETLTNDQYIERAGASAWRDGGDSQPVSVDASAVKMEKGDYDVIFSSGNAKVTVKATVKERTEDSEEILPEDIDPSIIDQLSDIYSDMNFAYPGWRLNMSSEAKNFVIDYVYSRQNKLEALTKTMELTPDLFWRVRFINEKVIDISKFGTHKQYIVSTKTSGNNNIQLVTEPTIEHDFEHVINLATVYSEKSVSGMSSMTLREVYNDTSLQEDGFPVVILRANVNNERDYRMYSEKLKKIAPNNEWEYAVIDEESVALESGELIEGTFAFNDLSPFSEEHDDENKEVTDEDRTKAAKTAYDAAVRKLKESRRRYKIEIEVGELPCDLAPGDMIRLIYDNSVLIEEPCSNYMKKILSYNDWFYLTRIQYRFEESGAEHTVLTLEKDLHLERETTND